MKHLNRIAALLFAAAFLLCGCTFGPAAGESPEPMHLYSGKNRSELYQAIYQAAKNYKSTVTVTGDPDTAVLSAICQQIGNEHPELFWFGGWNNAEFNGKTAVIKLNMPEPSEQNRIHHMYQELLAAADTVKAKIPAGADDYQKALTVHDYIIQHTVYDETAELGDTAYGCLVGHSAYCEGYSRAFLLLMNQLGLPAGLCRGKADSAGHMWNYVQLGDAYYWVDVTWDDPARENPDEDEETHGLCFVNDTILRYSHQITPNQHALPECSSMEMNYYVRNGWYLTDYDLSAVGQIIRSQADQPHIEIMFDDLRDVDHAVHFLFEEQQLWTIEGLPEALRTGACTYVTYDLVPLLRIDTEPAPAPDEAAGISAES